MCFNINADFVICLLKKYVQHNFRKKQFFSAISVFSYSIVALCVPL